MSEDHYEYDRLTERAVKEHGELRKEIAALKDQLSICESSRSTHLRVINDLRTELKAATQRIRGCLWGEDKQRAETLETQNTALKKLIKDYRHLPFSRHSSLDQRRRECDLKADQFLTEDREIAGRRLSQIRKEQQDEAGTAGRRD